MPQGSAKKIEVNLLLADLALQLGDPPPSRDALIRRFLPRQRSSPQRLRLARSARLPKTVQPSLPVLAVPPVQAAALDPDLQGYRRHSLAGRYALHGPALHFHWENSRLLHASSSLRETVRIFPVSLLGAATDARGGFRRSRSPVRLGLRGRLRRPLCCPQTDRPPHSHHGPHGRFHCARTMRASSRAMSRASKVAA